MTVLTARIELRDDATYAEREEAKINAVWKEEIRLSKAERMRTTNLDEKCGSCSHFRPIELASCISCGECNAGHPWGSRTRPACKDYRRKDEERY